MYCSECGSKLSQDAKFCYKCGAQVTQIAKDDKTKIASSDDKRVSVPGTTHTQGIKCPQCNRDDNVQKVTAIVAGQTHEISGGSWHTETYVDKKREKRSEGYYAPYSGTEQSVLAQKLSAPIKPDAGSNSETIMWAVALLGIAGLCGCLLLGGYTSGPGAFAIPIVSGILGIVIWISSNASHQKRVEQVQRVEMPRWEKAMSRWNKLYYCSRDDSIFIPSQDAVPSSRIRDYIYQSSVNIPIHTSDGQATQQDSIRGKVKVLKRYTEARENAEVLDNQELNQDTTPITIIRMGEEIKSTELLSVFCCPWCNKSYQAIPHGANIIFRCIKCNNLMTVTETL